MRAIFYYISLSLLLLCGGNYGYANVSPTPTNHSFFLGSSQDQQLKHIDSNHRTVVIEASDLDLDEEFHIDNDFNNGNSNAFLTNQSSLFTHWYILFAEQFVFKTISANNNFIQPYSGSSNPIYIKIGALRI